MEEWVLWWGTFTLRLLGRALFELKAPPNSGSKRSTVLPLVHPNPAWSRVGVAHNQKSVREGEPSFPLQLAFGFATDGG